MHSATITIHLVALERKIGVNQIVAENAAAGKEITILVEVFESLTQFGANRRDLGVFFRRQVVQILVGGFARMNLVLDAVKTGHQHRREGEIRIGRRIREADFDAASLGTGHVRNAQRSRTVASRVGKLHGSFKARHQTLVGVGGRVGEGVQGSSVLDDAADVIEGYFGKTGVTVAGKEVLILLPDGLVHVHTGTVVTEHGLGHEGSGLAIGGCHVPDRVLHDLQPVGALHKRGKTRADFTLTGSTHFVVVHFTGNPLLFKQRHHFGANVGERINRRNREVTALKRSAVAKVTAFVFNLACPRTFFGENLEKVLITFSMVLAFAMAIVIFMWLPLFIAERINFAGHDNLKALFEGVIRIIIFIAYIKLISRTEDIRRTFMYHGAEHKCINCIEHGLPLTVDNVAVSSKEHKRCGTSFIFIVMIISILFFMVVRPEGVLLRFASRIILIPVIAGVSYEFLRIAGRSDNPIVNALSRPGMWMQGLTTKEPDDDQIEVAIEAVKAVFDWESYLGENFPEGPDALGRELLIKAEKRNN